MHKVGTSNSKYNRFYSRAEDEVIRESVSHKLDRHLVNPSDKVWRDSNQTKTPTSPLQHFLYIRYTNEWHNDMVELVDVNINDPDSIKYITKFLIENTMIVTNEFLKSIDMPDIGSIPI